MWLDLIVLPRQGTAARAETLNTLTTKRNHYAIFDLSLIHI